MQNKKNKILYFIFMLFLLLFLCSCTNKKVMELRAYGIDYLENMNYEEALSYFDEAIKAGKGEVTSLQYDILQYKAECLFMLKRYDEAKKVYDTLLTINKFDKNYKEISEKLDLISLLISFKDALNNNNIEEAEKILLKLKENGKEHEKSVLFNQAVLYEKRGEWKDALNAFNYYLNQYPGDEDAMHEVEFINAELNNVN